MGQTKQNRRAHVERARDLFEPYGKQESTKGAKWTGQKSVFLAASTVRAALPEPPVSLVRSLLMSLSRNT
jgi:hypothetical protein